MKQIILSLVIFNISYYCIAQKSDEISIGRIDNVYSKGLNEKREFWVYVPKSDQNGKSAKQKYPVVYLLDGDTHFLAVAGLTHHLSINALCPEMIIVGILNTDRTRDLTPSTVSSDSTLSPEYGGGAKFMAFIENELIPHIDSTYPTEPFKMLIGHSLGGLTVMNTLLNHSNLFNSYVAIDPSMTDDNKLLLKGSKSKLAAKKFFGTSLFLGIANTIGIGMDTCKVKTDTDRATEHIRAILELSKNISDNKQNQLKYKYQYYSEESHNSVPLIAEYDAFHFIFDFYELKIPRSELMGINMATIAKINKHYENVTKQMGYKVNVPKPLANNIGYLCVRIKHYDEAEYLFKLNIANFPEDADVYDSLGDLYTAKGDKINAFNNYTKALSIDEMLETRQKLENLQK